MGLGGGCLGRLARVSRRLGGVSVWGRGVVGGGCRVWRGWGVVVAGLVIVSGSRVVGSGVPVFGVPGACGGSRVYGMGFGFRFGRRIAVREFDFCFFWSFLLVLAKFSFWPGDWVLGCHSMGF